MARHLIKETGDFRLFVSFGKCSEYVLDVFSNDDWDFLESFRSGSYLSFWLEEASSDVPSELVAFAGELPKKPSDFVVDAEALPSVDGLPDFWRFPNDYGLPSADREKFDFRRDVLGSPDRAFQKGKPEYHGVLAEVFDYRLIVSPNGKRYSVQRLQPSGLWSDVVVRKLLSNLLAVLPDEVPTVISEKALAFPDDPADCPRPWAEAQAERSEFVRRSNPSICDYLKVIKTDCHLRLIASPSGGQYWVQTRLKDGPWRFARAANCLSDLRGAVVPSGAPWPQGFSGVVVRSNRISDALERLPENPSHVVRF